MRNWTIFFSFLLYLIFSLEVGALPTVVIDHASDFIEIENEFFRPGLVSQALCLYGVREELWVPICHRLKDKSLNIIRMMKQRTAFMVPNPIEFPLNRNETPLILKEVLFEIFDETMFYYGVDQKPIVNFIFEYILMRQKFLLLKD